MTEMSLTPVEGLEKLQKKVRDYRGYGEMSNRQHSDETIRKQLSGKIKDLIKQLNAEFCAAEEKDQIRLDAFINSTKRKLVTINQSLKTPTYLQEIFFQATSIPTQWLVRIYQLELDMLKETGNIEVEISDLGQNEKEYAGIQENIMHIDAYVDNINQALFEREALILGDD